MSWVQSCRNIVLVPSNLSKKPNHLFNFFFFTRSARFSCFLCVFLVLEYLSMHIYWFLNIVGYYFPLDACVHCLSGSAYGNFNFCISFGSCICKVWLFNFYQWKGSLLLASLEKYIDGYLLEVSSVVTSDVQVSVSAEVCHYLVIHANEHDW